MNYKVKQNILILFGRVFKFFVQPVKYLSRNEISSMQSGMFCNLPLFQTLNVFTFSKISNDTFDDLYLSLKFLSLSDKWMLRRCFGRNNLKKLQVLRRSERIFLNWSWCKVINLSNYIHEKITWFWLAESSVVKHLCKLNMLILYYDLLKDNG